MLVLLATSGCGPPAAPVRHRASLGYLLTLGDLVEPDFVVQEPSHTLSRSDAAADRDAGTFASVNWLDGASVRYFRAVPTLSTSNGPIDLVDTVERFGDSVGAGRTLNSDADRRRQLPGDQPMSAGILGDAASADSILATAPDGVTVVQITLEWQVDDLVTTLRIRGRDGGTRLDDALLLARRQLSRELGATPILPSTPTTSPAPSPPSTTTPS